ncbi:minichromosome maintenance domain-containing protein 2-like isoform X2 [Anneissia japonica]|uniref:minichromosome maintenance domain-containing protein 2-like isoform X2 n=1 Tax=Anneissia japonica TaxID=1529436 RepID=UPI0014256971|nr:minichromosome maintenance domain-containing protein 2-like isoform X2 [Anneissia japonica]
MKSEVKPDNDINMQELHEAAVIYLDQTNHFEVLRQQCELYLQKAQSVYFYTICVNSADIVQYNVLGNIILNQPQLATKIFQEVVYIAIKSLSLLEDNPSCTQISVHIKLTCLPNLPSYILRPSELWKCKFESRFLQFNGVICSMTSKTNYTKCAKFRCPVPRCVGASENSHIRFHAAGVRESQTIRKDFSCIYCGAGLKEDVHHRILGDKLVVQMVDSAAFLSSNCVTSAQVTSGQVVLGSACRFQSIVAFFRDDLIDSVYLGGCYRIIGIPVKEIKGVATEVFVEVNNIIPQAIENVIIPSSIQHLLADHQQSPWGFISSLVDIFGVDISPQGTYHRLKLAILLSLVQTNTDKNASKLNILAVGSSTHIMSRLFAFGAKLVPRSTLPQSAEEMFASVSPETFGTGVCSIDGGSLALVDDGVCIVGEISAFKKDTLERLTAALEHKTEVLSIPRRYVESANLDEVSIPLRCSIWGTLYTCSRIGTEHLVGYEKAPTKTSDLSSAFQHGFNMVCICDGLESSNDTLADEKLAYAVLSSSMMTKETCAHNTTKSISIEDLKKFISFARNREVVLSKGAEVLLRGYFVGCRRARTSSIHATPIPHSALQTLLCLAHAHAKLCLRDEVLMEDATLAVLLYEEAMTIRFGCSVLSVKPSMHSSQPTSQNDQFMYHLQTQLIRFCESHAAEVFLSTHEE